MAKALIDKYLRSYEERRLPIYMELDILRKQNAHEQASLAFQKNVGCTLLDAAEFVRWFFDMRNYHEQQTILIAKREEDMRRGGWRPIRWADLERCS